MESPTNRKAEYATPRLLTLGSVKELTEDVLEKCTGSADATLPRDVPTQGDLNCGPF